MFLDNYKRDYQIKTGKKQGKNNWIAVLISVIAFAILYYFLT